MSDDNPLPDSINELKEYTRKSASGQGYPSDVLYYLVVILRLVAWLVLDRLNEKKSKVSKFYVLVLFEGGTELDREGPYKTFEERDAVAKKTWNEEMDGNSDRNLFWADVDENGELTVGAFTNLDMDDEYGY